jgi:hypothetical protein
MAGIPTLQPHTTTLDSLRSHLLFLLVRAQAEPLAKPFVDPIAALVPQWDAVDAERRKLSDAVLQAKANAVAADNALNKLADEVSAVVHDGKVPDLTNPLHLLYFGNEAPSDFKRPTLGAQLEAMKKWPSLLAKAEQPALLALVPAAENAVAAGTAADAALIEAEAALDKFELDGPLAALFAAYNSAAATTFGGLKALVHDQKALKLPATWPNTFFLHESRRKKPTTPAEAQKAVEKAKAELERAQQLLTDLQAKEQAVKDAAAAAEKAKADAAAAQKAAEDAKQRERNAGAALDKLRRAAP